ncbi:hypothetical protein [Bathymodiolus platifrons methanotrophic gill symbiont]|nr:hypothetical protein [Bathymodiolus platifrons methanotrophic gill symbiont]
MIPRTPEEIQRTASIKPLLEAELKKADYMIINIPIIEQKNATAGVGYLFDHHDSGSRYFCESLFWASQPKQAAKT